MAVSVVRAQVEADTDLTDIAALEPADGEMLYWATGGTRYNTTASQSYGRSLLNTANAAAAIALLDADLTTWAGITPGSGWSTALAAAALTPVTTKLYLDDFASGATTDCYNALVAANAANLGPVYLRAVNYPLSADVNITQNGFGLLGTGGSRTGTVSGSRITLASGVSIIVGSSTTHTADATFAGFDVQCSAGADYAFKLLSARNAKFHNISGTVQDFLKIGAGGTTITAIADSGGNCLITAAAHGIGVGQTVYVNNFEAAGATQIQSTYTVTAATTDTLTINLAYSASYVAAGLVQPHVTQVELSGYSLITTANNYGIDDYGFAGTLLMGENVLFTNSNFSSGTVPDTDTRGLFIRKGTSAYARRDWYKIHGGAFRLYHRNVDKQATRVTSFESTNTLLDGYGDYGIYFHEDTPDLTGGGLDVVKLIKPRFGLDNSTQEKAISIDASGASGAKIEIIAADISSTSTGIELIGGTSPTGLYQVILTDNCIDNRPTTGTVDAITATGYIADLQINSTTVRKPSGAGTSRDGIRFKTGFRGNARVNGVMTNGQTGYPVTVESGADPIIAEGLVNVSTAANRWSDTDGASLIEEAPYQHRGHRKTAGMLEIRNNGGTIEHRITAMCASATSGNAELLKKISGTSASYTTTPTGADASTAMAGGGKIGSATNYRFWFDTAAQTARDVQGQAVVAIETCGDAVKVYVQSVSLDINGTVRRRLCFDFYNAGTSWSPAASLGVGESIFVQFEVWIA